LAGAVEDSTAPRLAVLAPAGGHRLCSRCARPHLCQGRGRDDVRSGGGRNSVRVVVLRRGHALLAFSEWLDSAPAAERRLQRVLQTCPEGTERNGSRRVELDAFRPVLRSEFPAALRGSVSLLLRGGHHR